jgi:hypothetical protein
VIWSVVVAHVVGCLESLQEFLKNLLFRFLSRLNIRMAISSVDSTDVVNIDETTTILV